jgi:tRNA (guanine-N7-)-methyltransferase
LETVQTRGLLRVWMPGKPQTWKSGLRDSLPVPSQIVREAPQLRNSGNMGNSALQFPTSGGSVCALGSGRSVAWLARLFRVQEVVSSNLTAPTISVLHTSNSTAHLTDSTPSFPPTGADKPGGLIVELCSILDRIDLSQLFPRPQPLEVELGCGDGSFLMNYAKANPGRNFIGVERLLGRIRKIDRKGRRLGLVNLRGVRIESGYFLEFLLPRNSAEALHVYFPDPWPKLKHRRHRFINERFPMLAAQALKPMGTVHLRTDDADYFEQMKRVFAADRQFRETDASAALLSIKTDFELDFNASGIPTRQVSYQFLGRGPDQTSMIGPLPGPG